MCLLSNSIFPPELWRFKNCKSGLTKLFKSSYHHSLGIFLDLTFFVRHINCSFLVLEVNTIMRLQSFPIGRHSYSLICAKIAVVFVFREDNIFSKVLPNFFNNESYFGDKKNEKIFMSELITFSMKLIVIFNNFLLLLLKPLQKLLKFLLLELYVSDTTWHAKT